MQGSRVFLITLFHRHYEHEIPMPDSWSCMHYKRLMFQIRIRAWSFIEINPYVQPVARR